MQIIWYYSRYMKKNNKKIEVAVRLRPLIYEYEDVEAWCVNE
jgi:hypothetical protein